MIVAWLFHVWRRRGWRVEYRRDGRQAAAVQVCVSTYVSSKPLNIFKTNSGQFPAVFVAKKTPMFDGKLGHPQLCLWWTKQLFQAKTQGFSNPYQELIVPKPNQTLRIALWQEKNRKLKYQVRTFLWFYRKVFCQSTRSDLLCDVRSSKPETRLCYKSVCYQCGWLFRH